MKDFEKISNNPYLLDPRIQSEDTLDVYKSFWQILSENLIWIAISLLILISILLFIFLKRRNQNNNEIDDIEVQIDPYDEALQAIEELQAKKTNIQPKPFVFRLSEILRIYIQRDSRCLQWN